MKDIIDKAMERGFCEQVGQYHVDILPMRGPTVRVAMFTALIFSHSFLKAFFGEERIYQGDSDYVQYNYRSDNSGVVRWQYHARELVLAEDRIEYLEKFI
jgi:hypothetical protein